MRAGRVVAEGRPVRMRLDIAGRPDTIDFLAPATDDSTETSNDDQ